MNEIPSSIPKQAAEIKILNRKASNKEVKQNRQAKKSLNTLRLFDLNRPASI
jgi:hypothetical protein